MDKSKLAALTFFSIIGAGLNVAVSYVSQNTLNIPLYLDTVFTMTITFYGGLFWGVITGALTNLVFHSVFFTGWSYYLYTLCNVAVALVTALFIRWFPSELSLYKKEEAGKQQNSLKIQQLIGKAVILILLSFALCLIISIMGGIFATIINIIENPVYEIFEIVDPGMNFKFALERRGFPMLLIEIGSRIPVNILDRLLSSFTGYGIAMLMAKLLRKESTRLKVKN